jgi:hypothetical protein
VQAEEAVLVHEAKDEAVEGEDLKTTSNKPKTYTASSKAPEMKFIPHGIGKAVWLTATYQTVKDYIIHCKRDSTINHDFLV